MAQELFSDDRSISAPAPYTGTRDRRPRADALSEILRALHLTGAVFTDTLFTSPRHFRASRGGKAARVATAETGRVCVFYLVTDGECSLEMEEQPPLRLVAGDMALLPRGDAHHLISVSETAASTPARRSPRGAATAQSRLASGPATRIICGHLDCEPLVTRILFSGLAPAVRVNVRGSNAGAWLEASMRYALAEARSPAPGGSSVLAKLAEILIIETLRLCLHQQHTGEFNHGPGCLAGMADRIVGAVLDAMHNRPAHPWTLEELARVSATSRSVLAERFQTLVGVSPMQYLTQWRMLLAANILSESDTSLVRIAEAVGYQTDTAFSRAFRREFGVPPARWRKAQMPDKG